MLYQHFILARPKAFTTSEGGSYDSQICLVVAHCRKMVAPNAFNAERTTVTKIAKA